MLAPPQRPHARVSRSAVIRHENHQGVFLDIQFFQDLEHLTNRPVQLFDLGLEVSGRASIRRQEIRMPGPGEMHSGIGQVNEKGVLPFSLFANEPQRGPGGGVCQPPLVGHILDHRNGLPVS